MYSTQHYVIKFVTDRNDITEIVLKVAFNTITITLTLLVSVLSVLLFTDSDYSLGSHTHSGVFFMIDGSHTHSGAFI